MTINKSKLQESIVFAGFGGQGVMFAGQLLSYAAMNEGYHVTWIPSYGPEMRGGTANCFVMISDREIGSPVVQHPHIAVVFNLPSSQKFASLVEQGGLLVSNSSLINPVSQRNEIVQLVIPATDIASRLGNLQSANMVLLGAMLAARPILPLSAVQKALEEHVPAHRQELLAVNLEALSEGANCAVDA